MDTGFSDGFLSAGVASAFKPLINKIRNSEAAFKAHSVFAAGIIGGTTFIIVGGKFVVVNKN